MNTNFPIGTKYIKRNSRQDVCTVVDILTTFNAAGDIVSTTYIAEHEFCGQMVRERDVVRTTIAMGEIK
jgi:hypothetical protein